MGRLTTSAIEYLNDHFTLYEAEERLLSFGFVFRGFSVERGSDLRGKENETESWLAEEEAENNNNNEKRSGKSETEEHRAMVFRFPMERVQSWGVRVLTRGFIYIAKFLKINIIY